MFSRRSVLLVGPKYCWRFSIKERSGRFWVTSEMICTPLIAKGDQVDIKRFRPIDVHVERSQTFSIIHIHIRQIHAFSRISCKRNSILDRKEEIMRASNGQYRYLKSKYVAPSTFLAYGDKVAIFVWHLPYFVILVHNKDVARTYQHFFEFFWKLAKPI